MKKQIRKVSGLQETFVELEHGREFATPQEPSPKETSVEKETENYYGQAVESYHPKIYEVFQMNDNSKESNTRAIGVDIGTGFISCAEREEGQIKFRKIRDAFFKLNPSKFPRRCC